jgi:guanylate kinase
MQRLIDEDFFMEWAEFVDHRKGSASVVGLLATSRRVLFEIDMVGADILREQHPDLNHMFVLPESLKQLAERQRGRGDEDEAIIEARVAKAREEFLAAEVLAGGIELAINSDGAADAVAAQLGALACGIRLQPVDTRLHAKQHLHELVTA